MAVARASNLKQVLRQRLFPVPDHIARNFVDIKDEARIQLEKSIRDDYHQGWRGQSQYSEQAFQRDFENHLHRRLEVDRARYIPWLDHISPLQGKSILEIGCGTGSSTVALAEQGANVTGIDIDEGALQVARTRMKAYNLEAEFIVLNAQQLSQIFDTHSFDLVIFFACLEHMTVAERVSSIECVWNALRPEGFVAVIETPNRLWYFDSHTSGLPFYNWLPNELAFRYAKFSSRENFGELYHSCTPESMEHFLRRGRGVSFHEFELAIAPVPNIPVVGSLFDFEGLARRITLPRLYRRYKSVLQDVYPAVHGGFLDKSLNLILQKT